LAYSTERFVVDVVVSQELLGGEDEADLSEWLVEDGSQVDEGQPLLADVETSKVRLQIEAPANGTITFLVSEGAIIAPNTVIARVA
jgi:pyruvate/2-oxoglutarate dehydrogenase complex dihydrolipoamide acyltransferase (E2) component